GGGGKAQGEVAPHRREGTTGRGNPKALNNSSGDMSPFSGGVLSSAHPSLSRPGGGGFPTATAAGSDGAENAGDGSGAGGSIGDRRGDKQRGCGGTPAGFAPGGASTAPSAAPSTAAGMGCPTPPGYSGGPISSGAGSGSGGGARREGVPLSAH
ncbi:unnamed protein product, partial [Scytosiphon promiscuus]